MDYKKIYDNLIARAKNRILNEYVESHHIIPKCIGGLDDKENLVNLTPEEHYLAHQLLVKIYPEHNTLAYAASMMCSNRPSNKLYGWIRRRISNNMKNKNPMKLYPEKNPFNKKGKEHPSFNRQKTLKEKENISIRMKNKNPMHGKKPWNHPRSTEETKKIWRNADKYYEWWVNSGLDHGQNAMARAFNEEYKMTHSNLVKYFRNGWIPQNDQDWNDSCKI